MDNEFPETTDEHDDNSLNTSVVDTNVLDGESEQTEAPGESTNANDKSFCSNADDERNAAIAAAVADFDANDQCEEDDADDDTVNVIIKPSSKTGIYKTGTTYQARSIVHTTQHQKVARQGVELDDPGNINGIPTVEYNLSILGDEEKPWKRPGADITDYFNYGFTEETWVQYCEKQKILRQEYANTTLKPVLNSGGTGLLQRVRTGAVSSNSRSNETSKQASINVINLSTSGLNTRQINSVTNSKATSSPSDVSSRLLLNGNANNNSSLLSQFNQPPPGYLGGGDGNAVGGGTGVFNMPPPGFGSLTSAANSQVLNATNPAAVAAAAAAAAALFPNLAVPPPVVNNLAGWPNNNMALSGLIGPNDAVIDPATGQFTNIVDHGDRSPGSVFSNEDTASRRGRRHHHGDETSYFERYIPDGYRSRRRSRSSSREHYHSHHRRHRDSSRSGRDYERHRGTSRHSRRSRDRHSGDVGGADEQNPPEAVSPTTSHRSSGRRSERDRDRSGRDRSRERDRSRHRSERRDRERSERPSKQSDRHSSRRKEQPPPSPPRGMSQVTAITSEKQPTPSKVDPLSAAAAAAASIAAALGAPMPSSRIS
ncbi:unnamed protein product [Trichobilharzia szidati]|nr:unnamed protein product [Trichobilharzia szidati]CAH8854210.1 unnamed protein product [Trichobilharzia szidati]